ncbi:MAG: TRAP transporter small permease subunit [Marinibacterium sp.]|nr:TRAP transporter small permease subunit [Marinibacterium sp.]
MRLESLIAALAYAATTALLLADVIAREFFSQSLWGAQQMAVLCSILAAMVGLTLATGRSAHFRPEFADGVLPFKFVDRLGDVLSAALLLMFCFFAMEFVMESRSFSDRVPVVNILLWPVQIIVPYALVSSALKHLLFAWNPQAKIELKGG